jgi:hypothetical protein
LRFDVANVIEARRAGERGQEMLAGHKRARPAHCANFAQTIARAI